MDGAQNAIMTAKKREEGGCQVLCVRQRCFSNETTPPPSSLARLGGGGGGAGDNLSLQKMGGCSLRTVTWTPQTPPGDPQGETNLSPL